MTSGARYTGLIIVCIIMVAVAFHLGFMVGSLDTPASPVSTITDTEPEKERQATTSFSPYWKSWRLLEKHFVSASTSSKAISDKDRLWGSIRGLAHAYDDPHTTFLPPSDAKMFDQNISGNFGGVGMEIGKRDGVLTVVSPLPGTPASRADIRTQDKIIEVNDESTANMSVNEAVKRIRGKIGTTVSLTIAREGVDHPIDVDITRAQIEIPTLETTMRDDGIFVIKLHNFSEKSPRLFRNAMEEFVRSGSKRLILDVRQNPGGFLGASVDMASYFLPEGKVVVRQDAGEKHPNAKRAFRSKGYDVVHDDVEVVVLMNGGSASASEILAGALSEHGVATTVGERTFGKGSVQELFTVTEDPETSLKVTVARWLTPDGHFISHGIKPDVTVERSRQEYEAGVDPQMKKAVELLK